MVHDSTLRAEDCQPSPPFGSEPTPLRGDAEWWGRRVAGRGRGGQPRPVSPPALPRPPRFAGSCGVPAKPPGTRGIPGGGLQRLVPPGACSHSGLRRAAARVLLPQGYPESVSPDYLQYQCWDALQALCSTLTGALATRAVLQAVGVGDSAATVTGATLTWVLRDGVGMVTRIAFAWLQGTRLDCEAKQWRLAADVLNDLALVLELLAPAWPPIGPALLTLAAAVKCIVGVAGGATRAALAVHQARRDNMADVAAKDSSQETLVNGAGLLLALLLLPLLEGRPWLTGLVVTLLLVTHLGANVGAVGALCLPTLNRPRLRFALGGALRGVVRGGGGFGPPPHLGGEASSTSPAPRMSTPVSPLLPGFSTRLNLHLGAPLHRLVKSEAEFKKALECGTEDYIIVLRPSQGWVGVGLRQGAPPDTPLRACAQALLLEELLGPDLPLGAPMGAALRPLQRRLRHCPPGMVPWGVVAESSRLWRTLGPAFLRGLTAAGWETHRHLLAPDEWQLEWAGSEGGASGKPCPSPHPQ
ncbi:LOW QUALITY PROTEIN: RUS family member 1 [Falco cherrug]|uniref:LOW QUALITY PROTEIN: RUS family member 1 n=1 Tax=Falco cherrug TaxID=345164 RepID=UPI00247963EB|nr:LOW QUALITY PROTEIN: RUS family member 1 [Falco cherrug]